MDDWYTAQVRSPFRMMWKLSFVLTALSSCALAGYGQARTLICFGDSITAGYGLDPKQAYPADLEKLLHAHGYAYRVVNAGVSGNTTKDAAARVGSVVAMRPDAVLVEFGGNDGLRGVPIGSTRQNMDVVLTKLQASNIKVLLVGITLPPNYGADYIKSFAAMYRDAAAKHHVALMPMLYDKVYTVPGTIQEDGVHPTAKGSQLIAEHLLPLVEPLLRR